MAFFDGGEEVWGLCCFVIAYDFNVHISGFGKYCFSSFFFFLYDFKVETVFIWIKQVSNFHVRECNIFISQTDNDKGEGS